MPSSSAPPAARRWLLLAAKLGAAVLVVWFVGDAARQAATQLSASNLAIGWGWVALAGVVYLVALAPMAWFWRRTLQALGQPCRWADVLPAYYLGHLGKYVPGKALVVVLRTAALRREGGQAPAIAASVFVETLTMMAIGGAVASLLLITTAGDSANRSWLAPLAIGLAVVAALPTLPPVMRRLLAWLGKQASPSDAAGLTWGLLAQGWLAALLTWLGLALSLWLTVRALDDQLSADLSPAVRCLLAATLPVVAGFLSLLPGGLLVRDGLMFALLGPLSVVALPATLLLRLIWVVSEAAGYGIMELARRRMS